MTAPLRASPTDGGQMNLTRRQEILAFIVDYALSHQGPTPSIREIAHHFDLAYTTVYHHIDALMTEGYLEKRDGKLIVTGGQWVSPDP